VTFHARASSSGPTCGWGGHLTLIFVPLVALVVAFVLPLTPASASGLPRFEPKLREEQVFSSRAHLVESVVTNELEIDWQAEYVAAQALKEAEAKKEEAPWILASSGKNEPNGGKGNFPFTDDIFLGAAPQNRSFAAIQHHFVPSTTYAVRFRAENSNHEEARSNIFSFTSLGVTKPEIVPPEFFKPVPGQNLKGGATSPTTAAFQTQVESNGAQTEYHFEYSTSEEGPWTEANGDSCVATITVVKDFAEPECHFEGLAPETTYYARVRASNEDGTTVEVEQFRTPTARPIAGVNDVRNVTGASAHVLGDVSPHGLETHWYFEYSTSETGPWIAAPGAEGIITKTQAKALPEGSGVIVEGSLTGLSPSTVYYVRLYAENEVGEGRNGLGEPILTEKQGFASFKTSGAPSAATSAVHGLHGEALRVMGSVNPNSVPTSGEQVIIIEGSPTGGTFTLTFKGQSTVPIAFDAPAQGPNSVVEALQDLSTVIAGEVSVTGSDGGPYTIYFYGHNGRVSQPPIVADASGVTPSGAAVNVTVVQQGGEGYDTHYHFEYVSQKQFEAPSTEGGFAKANSTPPVDLAPGDSPSYVGADLPALEPSETYRFRIVATNTSPGGPVVYGEEEVLMVPLVPVSSPEAPSACPNATLRTSLSAHLPDCRAFEQITPVDKGGAQEIFNYGGKASQDARAGEDGNHLEYEGVIVKWGSGPGSGQSPYFFSRTESGWSMTAAAAQPEAGVFRYTPQLFSPDLGRFAFEAQWGTSPSNLSPHVEFEAGPPGGPYSMVASVPRVHLEAEPNVVAGWVAASKDFSKLVLQVSDHTLLGHSTHTQEGADLYEYSGGLRQVNVIGPAPGVTIGSCGASIVSASERNLIANSHAVSDDGSRVFFEAVPGKECSETKHLYLRVNGSGENAVTVDIGAYRFIAADPQGSKVLLERANGENSGLYLYDSQKASVKYLSLSGVAVGAQFVTSKDLSTVYIHSHDGALYRYDIGGETLLFVARIFIDNERNFYASSPDGRYFYFIATEVAGLPGGGQELETPGSHRKGQTSQVYRYDSVEALVQCMSCASSFDHYEPRLSALFTEGDRMTASANGEYVFFDTPAALLPSDVDGEVAPEETGAEHTSSNYSLSSDVYEWRRDGVGGCSYVQGCLALITSGHGGFLNTLLGTTATGRDVFFSTNESLLPSDNDTAGDIYDARSGGGFAEPVDPVECEGDACLTPFVPPNDSAPSSASFQGAGNMGTTVTEGKGKPKAKGKPRCKAKGKRKCKAKAKTRTGKKARHVVRHAHRSGRTGR
jgi:hypothetical protein